MEEALLFGIVQGIAEWLPVSSEGLIVLLGVNVFGRVDVTELVRVALFLHLGTFLAALLYFRRDVVELFRSLFNYRHASAENRSLLRFLIIATAVSGVVGGALFKLIAETEKLVFVSGAFVTGLIGVLLLATAALLLVKKNMAQRSSRSLSIQDGIIAGFVQGFAILPGLSRSGLTVSILLLRRLDDSAALRLSFLMSLPVVLGANIVLNLSLFSLSLSMLVALGSSFALGLITIHFLLAFARRINIGVFVLLFGLLMIGSLFVS